MTRKADESGTTSSQWLSKQSPFHAKQESENVILHWISTEQIRDEPLPLQGWSQGGEKGTILLRFLF